MRDRPKRNVDLEHCNCCIISCLPCISIWSCLEYALKGLCCCPCYIDIYCCDKNKKTVIPIIKPFTSISTESVKIQEENQSRS